MRDKNVSMVENKASVINVWSFVYILRLISVMEHAISHKRVALTSHLFIFFYYSLKDFLSLDLFLFLRVKGINFYRREPRVLTICEVSSDHIW